MQDSRCGELEAHCQLAHENCNWLSFYCNSNLRGSLRKGSKKQIMLSKSQFLYESRSLRWWSSLSCLPQESRVASGARPPLGVAARKKTKEDDQYNNAFNISSQNDRHVMPCPGRASSARDHSRSVMFTDACDNWVLRVSISGLECV